MWRSLFGFDGRFRRSQWWLSRLWVIGIFLAGLALASLFGGPAHDPEQTTPGDLVWMSLFALALVVSTWVNIAGTVRRWHDRGKSGWMTLVALIPIAGPLWILVKCGCLDGTQGPNRFGPSPKGLGGEAAAVTAAA